MLQFFNNFLIPQGTGVGIISANTRAICSAVTIIVVTIFIAIFRHYRIISLSWYFLCMRNDIFAWHLRYASTIDSPPVYSSFSMCQSHAANNVTCVIAAGRPWLSSVSVSERCHNCLWCNVSQVVFVARDVFNLEVCTGRAARGPGRTGPGPGREIN